MPMSINQPTRSATPVVGHPPADGVVLMPGGGETASAVGVTLIFKTVGAQSGGQFLALEYVAPPQFSGPPPHWHKITTEIFYVVEGHLTFTLDGEATTVGPGGYAFVPPGVVHGFANPTDAPARYFGIASPAGLENYFVELKAMLDKEPAWPPRDPSKLLALMAKYDTFPPEA